MLFPARLGERQSRKSSFAPSHSFMCGMQTVTYGSGAGRKLRKRREERPALFQALFASAYARSALFQLAGLTETIVRASASEDEMVVESNAEYLACLLHLPGKQPIEIAR